MVVQYNLELFVQLIMAGMLTPASGWCVCTSESGLSAVVRRCQPMLCMAFTCETG